ncbi:hypothetical protein ACIQ34_00350 [Ureibacillus sp. NPDC094379]
MASKAREARLVVYLIIMIFIVAFRRKIELLLPQQAMSVLLVVTFIYICCKVFLISPKKRVVDKV